MRIDKIVDADKVADIVRRMKVAEEEVLELRVASAAAAHLVNRAVCALSNLRIALSRAVDNHLDMDELKQPRRHVHEVATK